MTDPGTEERLARELIARLDKGGEGRLLSDGFEALLRYRAGRWLLGRLGVDTENLSTLVEDVHRLPREMAKHALAFAPLGWAPTGLDPHDAYADAATVYGRDGDAGAAEERLVAAWNEGDRLRLFIKRIYGFAHDHEPLRLTFHRRGQLLEKALEHHAAGSYEASVPIVLAQMDGIVYDLTGRTFFKAKVGDLGHVQDDSTLAGVPEGLSVVAQALSASVWTTGSTGELHRHGVLHGRELGYDTLRNSTKAFVALLAVLEWAKPRAEARARELQEAHEMKFAGSRERDADGRWLDRRGFGSAKESLETIERLQSRRFEQAGRYAATIGELVPTELRDAWLPQDPPNVEFSVSQNGREFWATVETPSGLVLAIGGLEGAAGPWLWAAERPPTTGPSDDSAWTDPAEPEPADWDWGREP